MYMCAQWLWDVGTARTSLPHARPFRKHARPFHKHTRTGHAHSTGSGPARVLSRAGGPSARHLARGQAPYTVRSRPGRIGHVRLGLVRSKLVRATLIAPKHCAQGKRHMRLQRANQCTATSSSSLSVEEASSLIFHVEHLFLLSLRRISPLGTNLTISKLYKLPSPFPSSPHFHSSIFFKGLERKRGRETER